MMKCFRYLYLTSTLNIRIVSISLTLTREGIRVGILEYVLTSGWEATSGSILRQDVSTSEDEHEDRHVSHGDTHTAAVVAVIDTALATEII